MTGLQWTVDAYLVVLASLLMLGGSMADRFGRRRIFQLGLVVFTLGSLLCSLAPSLVWLVVFRMIQAVGGSMLNPVALSIIRNTFDDPNERAQAIGVWGAVIGISLGLGPVVGGVLVHAVDWRAIFWVNIPVGVAAIALTARFVPESKADHPRRSTPSARSWSSCCWPRSPTRSSRAPRRAGVDRIVGFFLVAVVALGLLLWYERRRYEPLIDFRFFRSIPFSGATLTAVPSFAAFSGFLFLNTLYLQDVRGLSPLDAGLYTLPLAAMTIVMSPISGAVVGRRGPRLPLVVAGCALIVSEPDAHRAEHHDLVHLADPRLPGLRPRLRPGQPAHHPDGGVGHARRPSRRGRRRGLDQPSSGPGVGGGGSRGGGDVGVAGLAGAPGSPGPATSAGGSSPPVGSVCWCSAW